MCDSSAAVPPRGDGGGNVRVESQLADRLDQDVAFGVEVTDQRFDRHVDLLGPALRQG